MRQHRLGDLQRADHVGVELPANALDPKGLERAVGALAYVIEERVDPDEAGDAVSHRRDDRVRIGHVEPGDKSVFQYSQVRAVGRACMVVTRFQLIDWNRRAVALPKETP